MARRLEDSGMYRVLRRFEGRVDGPPPEDPDRRLLKAVYLDVETTGLQAGDSIIELAMVVFHHDEDGDVVCVSSAVDELEDPGRSIPPEVTSITGIDDRMVRGRRLNEAAILELLQGVHLVIAHNAGFDRHYVEQRLPAFTELPWACSMHDVDWSRAGVRSRKLEYLALARGLFYTAHRAVHDCHVGVELLRTPLYAGGPSALGDMLPRVRAGAVRVWAEASPFEKKDDLKARRYRWNSQGRVWWCDVPADQHEAELEWLAEHVYGSRRPLPFLRFDGRLRYSRRLPDAPPRDAERL